MKKHILFLIFISFGVWGCDDAHENLISLEPIRNAQCEPFVASVIFSWDKPENDNYYYTLVSYQTKEGKVLKKKISKFSTAPEDPKRVRAIVGGFTDIDEYEFTLVACGYDGTVSEPITVKGIPKDKSEAKDYVISTVNVEPISEGATVSWTNETNVGVELVLNYIDKTHKEQEVRFDATETKSENITNLAIEKPVDITIYAVNKEDGNQSASQTVTITPLLTQEDQVIPGAEYILSSYYGTLNMMTLTYNTPMKNEYTIMTSGNDPYVYTKLAQQPRGTTLVFRYKSTKKMIFQIFFMPRGQAPGPYQQVVTVPAAKEWTTFSYDYSAIIKKAGWGNAGDHLRLDFGSVANVQMEVRNMIFK